VGFVYFTFNIARKTDLSTIFRVFPATKRDFRKNHRQSATKKVSEYLSFAVDFSQKRLYIKCHHENFYREQLPIFRLLLAILRLTKPVCICPRET
jgi:hypothetical protein